MALVDEVQNRLGTQRLIELTNPGDTAAAAIDAGRLALAATDAEAEFATRCGVAYDNTVATHVMAGVEGVVYYLLKRAGLATQALRDAQESWRDALSAVAKVTGRNRILPATSSTLTASRDPTRTGVNTRPDFDLENTRDNELNAPRSGGNDERL